MADRRDTPTPRDAVLPAESRPVDLRWSPTKMRWCLRLPDGLQVTTDLDDAQAGQVAVALHAALADAEIAAAVRGADVEPVAWRVRYRSSHHWTIYQRPLEAWEHKGCILEPLYAAPPPPVPTVVAGGVRAGLEGALRIAEIEPAYPSAKPIEMQMRVEGYRDRGYNYGQIGLALVQSASSDTSKHIADKLRARLAASGTGTDGEPTPVLDADLREALENLLIAIGMGWDLDGVVDVARAALADTPAGPSHDGEVA